MAGEVRIDKKVTNDHTFSYLFGLVKVQHILTEQYYVGTSSSLSGKGDYLHTVKVYVCGNVVFTIDAHCKNVAQVYVEGDQLVGNILIKKKRL